MTITAIIFVIVQSLLARTLDSWWRVNANADAQQQLYKAQNILERDLASAAYEREVDRETIRIEKAPSALVHLTGSDGDVLWFLSAIDPVSGEFQRLPNGDPRWQRNILYYLVTPSSLSEFNYSGPGLDVGGYESACPYKILIRKEIDFDTVTTPASEGDDVEKLMLYDDIEPYLTRPVGYTLSGMTNLGEAMRPVSGNILTFRADFVDSVSGVTLDIRSTAIDRARREGPISDRDLASNPATQKLEITLFPPNRQGTASTTPPP